MSNLKDINYKHLPDEEKKKLQEKFHENDLNYFSSFAIETDSIGKDDLEEINKIIDKRLSNPLFKFNLSSLIFIGLGIVLGLSVYFFRDNNGKNNTLLSEEFKSKMPNISNSTPIVSGVDSVKNNTNNNLISTKEHFNISQAGEQLHLSTPMENINIKEINSIEVKEATYTPAEEILNYIPNASAIFIYDLKVANYKNYYFKNTRNIDIRDNGLSAQYSEKEEVNSITKRLQDRDYYAHEIIKDAMEAFHKKQFTLCIELLDLLRGYNKDDVNTQFYLGMSFFYLGDYNKAKSYFEKATNNNINIFLQESEFYTALCLKKTGKISEAKDLFKKIADKKLFYAERASEELN